MPLPVDLSVAELKKRLDKTLATDDGILFSYLEAAFHQAQQAPPWGCGRLLVPDPALVPVTPATNPPTYTDTGADVARTLAVWGRRVLVPDARAITSVVADTTALAVGEYESVKRNGVFVQLTLPRRRSSLQAYEPFKKVTITGKFGFASTPPELREGIYTLAARMYHEKADRYGDQVPLAETGPNQTYYRNLPARTKVAFASFTLPTGYGGVA